MKIYNIIKVGLTIIVVLVSSVFAVGKFWGVNRQESVPDNDDRIAYWTSTDGETDWTFQDNLSLAVSVNHIDVTKITRRNTDLYVMVTSVSDSLEIALSYDGLIWDGIDDRLLDDNYASWDQVLYRTEMLYKSDTDIDIYYSAYLDDAGTLRPHIGLINTDRKTLNFIFGDIECEGITIDGIYIK